MSDDEQTATEESETLPPVLRSAAHSFASPHLRSIAGLNSPLLKNINASMAALNSPLLKNINASMAALNSPLLKNINASIAPINTAAWFPQLKLIDPSAFGIDKVLAGFASNFFEQHRRQWDSVFESMRGLAERVFPPNWKGLNQPDLDVIELILLDEGIPLAWVPSQPILQAVFDSPNATARRLVLGRRWKGLTSDCEACLSEVSHADLRCHQPFAMDVVRAMRDGHASGAQALAANLLDSILRRNFDKDDFKAVTTNKKGGSRFDLDAYRIRVAFTLAPVWRAYAEYWESQGDPIPRAFGRHPSAHAVSTTQYSRINAVIGLMLVTSLLRLLDSELKR